MKKSLIAAGLVLSFSFTATAAMAECLPGWPAEWPADDPFCQDMPGDPGFAIACPSGVISECIVVEPPQEVIPEERLCDDENLNGLCDDEEVPSADLDEVTYDGRIIYEVIVDGYTALYPTTNLKFERVGSRYGQININFGGGRIAPMWVYGAWTSQGKNRLEEVQGRINLYHNGIVVQMAPTAINFQEFEQEVIADGGYVIRNNERTVDGSITLVQGDGTVSVGRFEKFTKVATDEFCPSGKKNGHSFGKAITKKTTKVKKGKGYAYAYSYGIDKNKYSLCQEGSIQTLLPTVTNLPLLTEMGKSNPAQFPNFGGVEIDQANGDILFRDKKKRVFARFLAEADLLAEDAIEADSVIETQDWVNFHKKCKLGGQKFTRK